MTASRARLAAPWRVVGLLIVGTAAAAVTGCHAPPPPHVAVVQPPPPPAPPPKPAPPRSYAASNWSFRVAEQSCVAQAQHKAMVFSVIVGPEREIDLTLETSAAYAVSRRQATGAVLRFDGEPGWTVRARMRGRIMAAQFPLDEKGLSHVLAVLGGGRLRSTVDGRAMPSLDLPDAGVAGRDWLACPRARMAGPTNQAVPVPQDGSRVSG